MPYDIKITQVQEGFVGEIAEKGQVLFTTSPLKDTPSVTKQISEFIKNKSKADKMQMANGPKKTQSFSPMDVSQYNVSVEVSRGRPPKSSCCGRG